MRTPKLYFGTAGFTYDDWYGMIYPQPKPRGFDPLTYISRYFDFVEINTSFYGPPKAETAKKWVERVAGNPDFVFTAKLYKRFTHERKEGFTKAEVKEARPGYEALMKEGKLAALLMQFPWSFKNDEANQEWLSDLISAFGDFPLVLEVRHASWNTPEVYDELREKGVGFVNIDQPIFSHSLKPSARATSTTAYIRWHGQNWRDWFRKEATRDERFDYLYSAKELEPWVDNIKKLVDTGSIDKLLVSANNHFEAKGAANVKMAESMLKKEKVKVPPTLMKTYEEILKPFAEADDEEAADPAPAAKKSVKRSAASRPAPRSRSRSRS